MSAPETDDLDNATFEEYLRVIHRLTGITIQPNRKFMLQGRVRPRLRELGLTYSTYLLHIEKDAEERQALIDAVTTNETYFYRTPRVWDYIVGELLPNWWTQNPGKTFRAWSAASSTGDEAHTLGILLQQFKDKNPGFQWEIVGTDLCTQVIATARKGLYTGRSIESFRNTKPDLFARYMRKETGEYYAALPEIRERIRFQSHHLFQRPTWATHSFDLILLRNVLIYFTPADQETVLSLIHTAMKDDGVLIIGESESLNQLKTPFAYQKPLVYQRGKAAA